jgi:uncharacterized protein YegP (UPF0339 family)
VIKWRTTGGDAVEVYAATAHREYRYRVRAANGEIVEQGSEGYTRKAAAVEAAGRHHPQVES